MYKSIFFITSVFFSFQVFALTSPSLVGQAPAAAKIPVKMEKHGEIRVDDYFWMKNRDSEPVLAHIKSENEFAAKNLAKAQSTIDKMFSETKKRIKEDDSSYPYQLGSNFYYLRYEKGKEYPIYCRKMNSLESKEEILLDLNVLAKGKKYFSASVVEYSPDQNIAAFAVDEVGRRFYHIYFKNLTTGEILKESIPNTTGNWVWADNKSGYYVRQHPDTLRAEKVFKFEFGKPKEDLVYFEKDEVFDVSLEKSLSKRFIFLVNRSFNASEYRYLDLKSTNPKFKLFLARENGHDYGLEDGEDGFYVRTNWKAEDFRLMKASYGATAKGQWKEILKFQPNVFFEDFLVFKKYFVLMVRDKGQVAFDIVERSKLRTQRVSFPDKDYFVSFDVNEDFQAEHFRYTYTSLIQPDSVYEANMQNSESKLLKIEDTPTYSKSLYVADRLWAPSYDGTPIPVSIVYRADKFNSGENPLLVYGYGSYGLSIDVEFDTSLISLLDRGFIYAIAHIRGGQEMGRDWYEKGRMNYKKNTFTDFIFSTEFLIKKGYGKPRHIYMKGESAGGLLMGAVLNLRPDLFNGVHAGVPFVDVLNTMLDPSIPLTTAEYEQWGNPNVSTDYHYIKSYSPYDNVKPQKYPNVLVTTGYHDSQVQYWEPLKWVAKLRENNKANTLIVVKTEMESGHSGVTGRFAELYEVCEQYGFFAWLEANNSK